MFKKLSVVFVFLVLLISCSDDNKLDSSSDSKNIDSISVTSSNPPVDQKNYKDVKIGTQFWITENLNVITFANGDPIPEARTDEEWKKAGVEGKPAWCYFNNNSKNGRLYNWYAVADKRGLSPDGYIVPKKSDWDQFWEYLSMKTHVIERLKNTSGWEYIDPFNPKKIIKKNGTNETGFSALPSGIRGPSCDFTDPVKANWWSSTEYYGDEASYSFLEETEIGTYDKSMGLAVRCIKKNKGYINK